MSYFTYNNRSDRYKSRVALISKRGPIALTEWGKRWEQLFVHSDATRLSRARSYARQNQILSLTIHELHIKAEVLGSLHIPYIVTIDMINPYSTAQWTDFIARLSKKSIYLASFLEGLLPAEIETVFDDPHNPLFPTSLDTACSLSCSCYDWNTSCKHTLAVLYILTEMIDNNPLLIFQLRGKSIEDSIKAIKRITAYKNTPQQSEPIQKIELFWQERQDVHLPLLPGELPSVNAYTLLGGAPWKAESKNIKALLTPLYAHLRELAQTIKNSSKKDTNDL
ncbi:hypothetical protein H0W26_06140 [Candidatus Dependentiae bacterium]|nr:hypothetical protein [Candidatus Dependentiae bacterium]